MAEVLNLKFNGSHGSTTFTEDATGKTATALGNAQLTIAEKISGTAALLLDGNGDGVSFADSADWEVGSNDWEIRGWFRLNALGSSQVIFGMRAAGNQQFYLRVTAANKLAFHCEVAGAAWGTATATLTGAATLTAGIWYYFKLKKSSTTVNILLSTDRATFTTDATGTGYSGSGPTGVFLPTLGCGHDASGNVAATSENFNGWMDDFIFNNGAVTSDVVPDVPDSGIFLAM